MQPFPRKSQNACRFSACFKLLGGFKAQHDARKSTVELFHPNGHSAAGRIVQDCFTLAETAENNKMIEIPMQDDGKGTLLYIVDLHAVSGRIKAVTPRGANHITRAAAVTGYAAVGAYLLQRKPFSIIGQYHCKACRATFERFHLHYNRDFHDFLRHARPLKFPSKAHTAFVRPIPQEYRTPCRLKAEPRSLPDLTKGRNLPAPRLWDQA